MAEVLVQGRESGREGGIAVTHVQRLQRGDFRHNRFFYRRSTDLMRSLPSLPLERMSAVFSSGVARCLKNMESCILRCKEPGWVAGFGVTGTLL